MGYHNAEHNSWSWRTIDCEVSGDMHARAFSMTNIGPPWPSLQVAWEKSKGWHDQDIFWRPHRHLASSSVTDFMASVFGPHWRQEAHNRGTSPTSAVMVCACGTTQPRRFFLLHAGVCSSCATPFVMSGMFSLSLIHI